MRNNLKNSSAYLCGCMDRVKDGGIGWRNYVKPFLQELGVIVYDPCDKPTKRSIEDIEARKQIEQIKNAGRYEAIRPNFKQIRNVDLHLVDISSFLIVNLDLDQHPCGTYEEIFWANRCHKPILIRMEQGKRHAPNWLFFTLPHHFIFNTWEEIFKYLREIDDTMFDVSNRWIFLK